MILFTDLVHCTNEPNVSIPQLANLLVERTQNTNWVVVYKALITVHHLLAYGNEVRRCLSLFCFVLRHYSCSSSAIVGSIPTRGIEIFNFPRFSNESKRSVEFRYSTRNIFRIQRNVRNESVVMGTECHKTRFPILLCVMGYSVKHKNK